MDYMKIVRMVRNGKIAIITGTASELRHTIHGLLFILDASFKRGEQIFIQRRGSVAYVYKTRPLQIRFVEKKLLPFLSRQ